MIFYSIDGKQFRCYGIVCRYSIEEKHKEITIQIRMLRPKLLEEFFHSSKEVFDIFVPFFGNYFSIDIVQVYLEAESDDVGFRTYEVKPAIDK